MESAKSEPAVRSRTSQASSPPPSASSARFSSLQSAFYKKTSFAPKLKKRKAVEAKEETKVDKAKEEEAALDQSAADELLSSAARQSASASVVGPCLAYLPNKRPAKINRRFLDNTLVQTIGENLRREREQAERSRKRKADRQTPADATQMKRPTN